MGRFGFSFSLRRSWPALAVLLPASLLTAGLLAGWLVLARPPQREAMVEVQIPSGTSLEQIAGRLEQQRVIASAPAFRALAHLSGRSRSLQAGNYQIPPGASLREVLELLVSGRGRMLRITLPEGLTDQQVYGRLAAVLAGVDSTGLARLAAGDSLAASFGLEAPSLHGYLFPDTYLVHPTIGAIELLRLMADRYREVWAELHQRQPRNGLDDHQSVILASIVEKEAVAAAERPVIASVFLNRLELGRPLESCATVLFVLGGHRSRLYYRDLEVESPYNTYLHAGLPPGPICNPGRASLEAALFPADSGYLYFVARGDGTHVFSRSLEEHNRAKGRFLRAGRVR